jgi:hypothetical protein
MKLHSWFAAYAPARPTLTRDWAGGEGWSPVAYDAECFFASDPAELVPLASIPVEEVLAYDASHFFSPRETFLNAWLAQPASTGYALRRHGRLAGFGMRRPCLVGCKIGPLFADEAAAASLLLRVLLAAVPGQWVYLDAPEVNPGVAKLSAQFEMVEVFRTARMHTQGPPTLSMDPIVGATTLELG